MAFFKFKYKQGSILEVCQLLDKIPALRKGLGGPVVRELSMSQWPVALEPS